jgi:hypothetical protein
VRADQHPVRRAAVPQLSRGEVVLAEDVDLSIVRSGTALASVLLLLIGLIWEDR